MLFTFPSRYSFTIGQSVVFSLTGWSPQILAGLHVSCDTQVPATYVHVSLTGLSPSLAGLSMPFDYDPFGCCGPYNPSELSFLGLGLSLFARRY